MDKFSSWLRIILTWVVIIPNLMISYLYLRFPSYNLELTSLGLNFVCATVLFYVYMDIYKTNSSDESGEAQKTTTGENSFFLYKLTFGSLIEDVAIWLGLFFFFYNIVPVTLFVHHMIGRILFFS